MTIETDLTLTKSQTKAWKLLNEKDTRILVLRWSRQSGKTVFCEIVILNYLFTPRSQNAYISPTYAQGRKVYKELVNLLSSHPSVASYVQSTNASTLTITMKNGAVLQFFSAESPTSIRGNTVNGVCIIDEAAFLPDQLADGTDIWSNVIYPIIKAHYYTNKTIVVSTPNGKRGFYYDLFMRAMNVGEKEDASGKKWGARNRGIKAMTATIEDDELIDYQQLSEIKEMTPPLAYAQEFMCKFVDSAITYFNGFEHCFDNQTVTDLSKIWVGVDLSGYGSDETILTFINALSQAKQIKIRGTLTERYNKIADFINTHRPTLTLIEQNGIGAPMYDEIIKLVSPSIKSRVQPFTTTNTSKNDICGYLALLIDKKAIHFESDDKELYSQFGTFIYKFTKHGAMQLEAMAGHHDDRIMSLAIACEAMKQGNKSGVYSIDRLRPNRKPMDIWEHYDNPQAYREEQEYRKKYILV